MIKHHSSLKWRVLPFVLTGLFLVLIAQPGAVYGTVRFIVVGDTRGDDNGVSTAILGEIVQATIDEGADFILIPGDLVNGSSSQSELESQLTTWLTTMAPLYNAGIGVYPCRGNHDIGSKAAWDNVFSGMYALPANGPSGEENITFSFTYDNVFIVGLDQYVTYRRVNQAWLDEQFALNSAPHIFVFGHEPAFKLIHYDCLDNFPSERNTFWQSMAAVGGRIYFAGHDHCYDHARLDDGDGDPNDDLHQYIVATGGAHLYDDSLYDGVNGFWTPQRIHHEKKYGYVLVEVNNLEAFVTWKARIAEGVYEARDQFIFTTVNNESPKADAGGNQTVDEGATVLLDGSSSTDPDDVIVSYLWEQTDGPGVTLAGADTLQASFTAPDVGPSGTSLTFQLTVADSGGLQGTDTCTVNVSWENEPPKTDAGGNQTVDEGATVLLDGSSSTDPDDVIVSYLWEQTDGPGVTLAGADTLQASFTAPDVGPSGTSLTFQLTVADSGGLQGTDTCTVNVSWENEPPKTDAGGNQTVDEGETVLLDGSGSTDPDDVIVSYLWEQTDGPGVTLAGADTLQASFTAPDVGPSGTSLTFQLTVADSGGLQGTDTCTVNVSWENEPPSTSKSGGGGGGVGCFIATAAFGSSTKSHVEILLNFRDHFMPTNRVGKAFVQLYHDYSPPTEDFISKHNSLRATLHLSLLPLAGTSYLALNIGPVPTMVSVILLLAMTITSAAACFRKIRLLAEKT